MENKVSFKQILWYFIFFSIIGLFIETIFCFITTGVFESRKGLIWGPFCPVYGVGAAVLILILNKYENNSLKIFLIGSIFGNIIEYLLSFGLEALYGSRFWDYSYLKWHLNGRICFIYSFYWGALAFILIKWIKNPMDKIINKISNSKILHISIVIFFIVDSLATVWAITTYQNRIGSEFYNSENNIKENFITKTLFSNEIMVKTFPNLRYIEADGTEKYIRDIINSN